MHVVFNTKGTEKRQQRVGKTSRLPRPEEDLSREPNISRKIYGVRRRLFVNQSPGND